MMKMLSPLLILACGVALGLIDSALAVSPLDPYSNIQPEPLGKVRQSKRIGRPLETADLDASASCPTEMLKDLKDGAVSAGATMADLSRAAGEKTFAGGRLVARGILWSGQKTKDGLSSAMSTSAGFVVKGLKSAGHGMVESTGKIADSTKAASSKMVMAPKFKAKGQSLDQKGKEIAGTGFGARLSGWFGRPKQNAMTAEVLNQSAQ